GSQNISGVEVEHCDVADENRVSSAFLPAILSLPVSCNQTFSLRPMRRNPNPAAIKRTPRKPITGRLLPVSGSRGCGSWAWATWTGAGGGAAAGAGAGAAGRACATSFVGAGAGGVCATTLFGAGGGGACPVTTVLEAISVLGSSTIFCAETLMPFLRSKTVASLLPSMLNLSSSFTVYCRFSPFASVKI